jgi:hypothetical protein
MTRWRIHEERARRSSFFRGYKVQSQKTSTSTGRRPDYFGISKTNPRNRLVADVKYVKELTSGHVRQVRQYKGYPFFAQKAAIITKKSTRVPKEVREMARESNIKIIKKNARHSTRQPRSILDTIFGW